MDTRMKWIRFLLVAFVAGVAGETMYGLVVATAIPVFWTAIISTVVAVASFYLVVHVIDKLKLV